MYEKYPWELGYPHYEEFDNILPFIMSQINKKKKRDEDIAKDYEEQQRGMAGVK
jgi:hypothetical protein